MITREAADLLNKLRSLAFGISGPWGSQDSGRERDPLVWPTGRATSDDCGRRGAPDRIRTQDTCQPCCGVVDTPQNPASSAGAVCPGVWGINFFSASTTIKGTKGSVNDFSSWGD